MGEVVSVELEMVTVPGSLYPMVDVEFLVPENDTAVFSICQLAIISVGNNLPCLSANNSNGGVVYTPA